MPKNDPPNEDEVKRAAEMREWVEERIGELEMELSRLRDMQTIVDSILRRTSFVPATELRAPASRNSETNRSQEGSSTESGAKSQLQAPVPKPAEEARQLRRSKDGMLIATAFVTNSKIVVVPSSDVKLPQTIPPFQTFFVNRILKGYEAKDQELASAGKLSSSEAMKFTIEEAEGNISKVTVDNYRDKARLNEILSTVNWAFIRMLEKK
ncbi:MAG: hypothetical protein OK457_07790 [Thaumarchaeota archaeon]|nr:hypothetical protein [Nitrososphaerota archaeon]